MRALKMSTVAGHQKVTTNGEQSLKLIPLQPHKKLPKNSVSPILWLFGIWSKLERWKNSTSECLMSWLEINKKIGILKSHLLLFYATVNLFQLDCDVRQKVDYIWQLVMTSSVVGPRRNSKALSKAIFAPKKDHDHCLGVCCPCDPLQLSEAQWNYHIWEVCSANWWDPLKTATSAASISQQKGPNSFLRVYIT